MSTFDLRRLQLRPGEIRHETVDVDLEPFFLGGQRYEVTPAIVPAELRIAQPSGATVLDLEFHAHVAGPCMRCLGFAELELDVAAREFHDPDAPGGDELRSDYGVADALQIGTWARDAIALELPDQLVCRPDCAGLCPVCGKDLNVEPPEHAEVAVDPRWAALEQLRDDR